MGVSKLSESYGADGVKAEIGAVVLDRRLAWWLASLMGSVQPLGWPRVAEEPDG